MYICVNDRNRVIAVSDYPINISNCQTTKTDANIKIGQKLISVPTSKLKIAFVCNWDSHCGISTYSKFLVECLSSKVGEIKIFSEEIENKKEGVVYCWKRGENLQQLGEAITAYKPDFVIIQHDYGLFPNIRFFIQFIHKISDYPYVVTFHSVYEKFNSLLGMQAVRNCIVHTEMSKQILLSMDYSGNVFVVPHGCFEFELNGNNFLGNNIIQFGFGFSYKGVEKMLEALRILKDKIPDILYCYLCSENKHNVNIHEQYRDSLICKAKALGVNDNFVLLRGFFSEEVINAYLQGSNCCVFPYVDNPHNAVYGASGAVRIAMANHVPTVISDSHMFDDLEGILPRPISVEALAEEIFNIIFDKDYACNIVKQSDKFIKTNSWEFTANKYLEVYHDIVSML